jgi:hypothetical protein
MVTPARCWCRGQVLTTEGAVVGLQVLKDAGWHLTYLMSPAEIQRKLASFIHTELWGAEGFTVEDIAAAVAEGCVVVTPGPNCTHACTPRTHNAVVAAPSPRHLRGSRGGM